MRPLRRVADVVAGAADPLQPGRDRLRRLDLQHEVDGAHVDPQLQARGRDDAGDLARLQQLLDDEPLLARERAVVGAGDLDGRRRSPDPPRPRRDSSFASSFSRSAIRSAERRLLTNRIVERCCWISAAARDRSPARSSGASPRCRRRAGRGRARVVGVRLDHRLDRHVDLQVERLAHAGVDDAASAPRADHEAADLLQRVLRRREADALHLAAAVLLLRERVEPLERQREVRAALRAGDGVDLVDDDPLRPAQDLARSLVSIR